MPPLVEFEATRPVVSSVSTVMEPLSKWTDCQIQKVVHLYRAYTMDSWQFLNNIKHLNNLNGCKLLMVDAVGMYTNSNTHHACDCIQDWFVLHKNGIPKDFPSELVVKSIERLKRFNVFTFGSRLFLQENGMAMGTNVGCMYATTCYSYHEGEKFLCLSVVHFNYQLIEDTFKVIDSDPHSYTSLVKTMNRYGPEDNAWNGKQPNQVALCCFFRFKGFYAYKW